MPQIHSPHFGGLPDVEHFGVLDSCEQAVDRLFKGEYDGLACCLVEGGELFRAFTLVQDNKAYFVKVIREDNPYSRNMYYAYEWEVKQAVVVQNKLNSVNAEMVFPEHGGTFVIKDQLHYITSYPYVAGISLDDLFYDYVDILRARGAEALKKERLEKELLRGFYRFGEAFAVLQLDPDLPPEAPEKVLAQMPRLPLSDRNTANEMYDPLSDRIYLIDLAEERDEDDDPVNVRNELYYWFESLLDQALTFGEYLGDDQQRDVALLSETLNSFMNGYRAALPAYSEETMRVILHETCLELLHHEANDHPWLVAVIQRLSYCDPS